MKDTDVVDLSENAANPHIDEPSKLGQPEPMVLVALSIESIKLLYTLLEQVPLPGPDAKALGSDTQRRFIEAVSVIQ